MNNTHHHYCHCYRCQNNHFQSSGARDCVHGQRGEDHQRGLSTPQQRPGSACWLHHIQLHACWRRVWIAIFWKMHVLPHRVSLYLFILTPWSLRIEDDMYGIHTHSWSHQKKSTQVYWRSFIGLPEKPLWNWIKSQITTKNCCQIQCDRTSFIFPGPFTRCCTRPLPPFTFSICFEESRKWPWPGRRWVVTT